MAAVEWGPVGIWAGAIATVQAVITTAPGIAGLLRRLQGPRLRLAFEATEPWCRQGETEEDGTALWVRVGVDILGARPAGVPWPADQRDDQRRGTARCEPGAAALGRSANDPVLTAEATMKEALYGK